MFDISKVLGIIKTAGQSLPIVRDTVQAFLPLLSSQDQATLKAAYEREMRESDQAEDDFVKASRGQ